MRNLYQDLGFDRIVEDPERIAAAIAASPLPPPARRAAAFVLQEPDRKARYDWALSAAQELAGCRARMGLGPEGFLASSPTRRSGEQGQPFPLKSGLPTLAVVGTVVLALAGILVWLGSLASAPVGAPAGPTVPVLGSSTPNSPPPAPPESGASPGHNPRLPFPGLVQVPPPDHGWMRTESTFEPTVPWRVDTDPGEDYLLTLKEARTGRTVLSLYLKGGKPFQGLVPQGEFELSYTSGSFWYGFEHQFGPGSQVVNTGQTFRILEAGGEWALRLRPALEAQGAKP